MSPKVIDQPWRWLLLSLSVGLVAAGLYLGAVPLARADIAPFDVVQGGVVGPVFDTPVRMVSETVTLEVREDLTFTMGTDYHQWLGARVTADFLLRNPETLTQSLAIGFPRYFPPAESIASGLIPIVNLRAYLNGVERATRTETMVGGAWDVWAAELPPGDTLVRVTYDAPAFLFSQAAMGYILHTGAAWAGPIGQADIVVRFPYVLEAMALDSVHPAGYQMEVNEVRWHFENLEPTATDDISLSFITPESWTRVAEARAAVQAEPSAGNYLKLGDTYGDIVFPSHNNFDSPLVAQMAEAQYKKALALEPDNKAVRAAYCGFITWHAGREIPFDRWFEALALCPDDEYLPENFAHDFAYRGDELPPDVQATAIAILGSDPRQATLVPPTPRPMLSTSTPWFTVPASTPAATAALSQTVALPAIGSWSAPDNSAPEPRSSINWDRIVIVVLIGAVIAWLILTILSRRRRA